MSLLFTSASDLYSYVPDMDVGIFMEEIEAVKKEFFGLIDDTAAAALVITKSGKRPHPCRLISNAADGDEVTLPVEITEFSDVGTFIQHTKNGDREREYIVVVVRDRDDTAEITVWSPRVIESIKSGLITTGNYLIHKVKCDSSAERRFSLMQGAFFVRVTPEELNHIWDILESVDFAQPPVYRTIGDILGIDTDTVKRRHFLADLEVMVVGKDDFYVKEKKDSVVMRQKLDLTDGTGNITLVLWGDMALAFRNIELGAELRIKNAVIYYSDWSGAIELKASRDTVIQKVADDE